MMERNILSPHGVHVRQAASQVLLVGVSGGFSQSSHFSPLTDWPVSYKLKFS